jgi:hypothetical protein
MFKSFSTIPMTVTIKDPGYCGRIDINDNPLMICSESIENLKERMKALVYEFEGFHVDDFDCQFTNIQPQT